MKKSDYLAARQNMIDSQLRPNKIKATPLLQRFMDVPREMFADATSRAVAYMDNPLPIGEGRTIFAPMTIARMLQELDFQPTDKVLVLAAGTGYTACLIAPLVKEVVALEQNGYLFDVARRAAADLQLANIEFHNQAPEKGMPKAGLYDKIVIDAGVAEVPPAIVDQLAENGRLGAVVEAANGLKEVTVFTKLGKTLFEQQLFETKADVLPNFKPEERFVF